MNSYILKVVASDLKYLGEEWDQDIDDDSLRRSSNVLRMLLVDGKLLEVWRSAGFDDQPQIVAPTLEEHLKRFRLEDIQLAQAGGAEFKGITVAAIFTLSTSLNQEQIKELYALGPRVHTASYKLADFIESPCIIVEGIIITRRELVKYVANKLGGAHIDQRRDISKPQERKFVYLDKIRETMQVAGKPAIYYELLSIGQSLVRSDDIKRLRQRLDNLIPHQT